ncbi:hypothetical protein PAXRUDRAFT_36112 [Paxillus rubicundulus Ve08.2h10]|uniref:RNase H type-1 domain-containing protein n=1 Tax=Paxillus rubicundulus Ve08.2h10 TaxID=930991 RepID=A0A0D0CYJ0_9AGAM|nr:hypothetical protein PAXRUDRAFT_36112 [Paxillus rubicundulus Ve08.2h10]
MCTDWTPLELKKLTARGIHRIEENTGAAVVLYARGKEPQTMRYHLGTAKEHTVYEAEAVGLNLAAQLLTISKDLKTPINIYVDNQAVIRSSNMFDSKPGHYLVDHFCNTIAKLQRKMKLTKTDITVRWISGHDRVEGNERADEEAKEAAKSAGNNSLRKCLPTFLILAIKQEQNSITKKCWERLWAKSPRHAHTLKYDKNLLSGSFMKLASNLPRRHASILVWLRTKHVLLNAHLHKITKADSSDCPHCPGTREDVPHFIL